MSPSSSEFISISLSRWDRGRICLSLTSKADGNLYTESSEREGMIINDDVASRKNIPTSNHFTNV